MSKITFLATKNDAYKDVLHYYEDIAKNFRIGIDDVVVSDLSFLSFDLLDQGFSSIELFYGGVFYDLKLGKNDWTEKELRKEHNLLKLVRSYILEK